MVEHDEVVPSSQSGDDDIILAISYSAGYLGAAIYDQGHTTIKLLHDVAEDHEFRLLTALMQQEEPTTVLSNKAQDIRLVSFICIQCGKDPPPDDVYLENSSELERTSVTQSSVSLAGDGDNSVETDDTIVQSIVEENEDRKEEEAKSEEDDKDEYSDDEDFETDPKVPTLIFLSNNAYNYESGFKRISELFAGECFSESENQLVTRFRIDISSRNMVRALGALLKYLDSARIGVEFEPLNVRTPVTSIKSLVVAEMVEIDKTTYRALDIFAENKKAERTFRGGVANSRSAISLFSLCNRCKSGVGRSRLRKWFERPTTNQDVLRSRQQAISYFLQDCNLDITAKIYGHLGSMRSMRYLLNRLRSGTAKVRHWESLYKMISNAVSIGRYMETLSTKLTLVEDDLECFGDTLAETMAVLGAMIDFHDSLVENRLVVSSGVDPELDRAKELYRRLPGILTQVAQDESKRLQADTCSVAYVPMIGYLLAVPYDFNVERFDDLQVIYSTDDTLNVKSKRMRELDEELGDVKMKIIDKETTIAVRMSSLIVSRTSLLLGIERVTSLLDAAISLALTARQLGWNCPKFVEEPIIDATRVVHPLSKLVTEHFVANPVSSGGDSSRIKIFTGPNACGKSVYLKQVGLLVFLAHIGSFVPAEVAHIGIVNRIFTRIYTVDSVLDGMSTFACDLNQVSLAMRRGNQRSLIIIDEFGKGTLTEVGLPLLSSTLSYWAAKGQNDCPHVYEHVRKGHGIGDFVIDSEEEQKNRWLAKQMLEILPQLEEWDIDQDLNGLLNLLQEKLFEADEIIDNGSVGEIAKAKEVEHSEEVQKCSQDRTENPSTGEESDTSLSGEEEEDCDHETQFIVEELTSPIPSALRSGERKSDRSNLSVSFALDKNDYIADDECSRTTMHSYEEKTEKIKRIVIAGSDDEWSVEKSEDSSRIQPSLREEVRFIPF
ncbi:BMA-MSH-5 isoform d [Trichostrongylus colubriformis]|uniref:BMA-MSH-5 isoform d n=1 Tax=Trichostrongylus colubriformis TaxID=6319 RepID=A0AAN8IUH3_TRICO